MASKAYNNCIVIKTAKHIKYITCVIIELQIKSSFEQMCLEWAFKSVDRFAVSDFPW